VISGGNEAVSPFDYIDFGQVTEFNYQRSLGSLVKDASQFQRIIDLGNAAQDSFGLVPSRSAVIFIDNHDTQRNDDHPAIYKDGDLYNFYNLVMLALPYGFPKIMSSYDFHNTDQGPPKQSVHDSSHSFVNHNNNVNCGNGDWVCEHRWSQIANMVAWKRAAGSETKMENIITEDDSNHVAFSRNGKAFIALNRNENDAWTMSSIYTGLPSGDYCNVIENDDVKSCDTISVNNDGMIEDEINVPKFSAFAIHTNAKK